MSDRNQLPHLVKLFDDESPTVRDAVARALADFGDDLEDALSALPDAPDERTRRLICTRVDDWRSGRAAPAARPPRTKEVLFRPGELVRHRRYGYRGVVVGFDRHCRADDAWYRGNRTQPARAQPWYHVLVDGSSATTYAAQTSLVTDDSKTEVAHPLVAKFFESFEDGVYVRNGRPWPQG